ncbi:NHLP-related RiPP peptide [Stenotrophomonas sp. YIM B06876]|uniref:NHLP-related RiPP peptide n=1 Tax=Stenotrophomonas sp. YIM B06876 TaxID=3060211 RepID=UPI002739EB1F|nr:NHLP-related RiPP peptide [Stenotrophomonas sp. YIM B06876]
MQDHTRAGHPPLAPAFAARLLAELAENDAFRLHFAGDPAAALQSLGLSPAAAAAALQGSSCLKVEALASKQDIRNSRELLQNYLTSHGSHTVVYCLEAGRTDVLSARQPRQDRP